MEKHGITSGRRSGSSFGSDGVRVSHDVVNAEDTVPGHQLDVELAEVSHSLSKTDPYLTRLATRPRGSREDRNARKCQEQDQSDIERRQRPE